MAYNRGGRANVEHLRSQGGLRKGHRARDQQQHTAKRATRISSFHRPMTFTRNLAKHRTTIHPLLQPTSSGLDCALFLIGKLLNQNSKPVKFSPQKDSQHDVTHSRSFWKCPTGINITTTSNHAYP
jgi:hypothetical protein